MTTTTYSLTWISADGQGFLEMGTYPTHEAAQAAIPAAKAELLDQCGEDSQRDGLEAGRWDIAES